jgi:DNA-binding NarL/FixJ family response regulator
VHGDEEPRLTDRELEVLRALAEGLGNKHIGAQLGISPSTVKYHLQAIFAKLGVSTRSEAVSYGLRRGVVPL